MNKKQVKNDFVESSENLLNILSPVPDKNFNKKPGEDGWTVGMAAEHLIKVESGTLKLFSGPVGPAERDPEEKILTIKGRLLDYNTAMTAYGPIVPNDKIKDKTKALVKMQDIRQKLTGLIEIQNLEELITGFEHPLFGFLTRIEWIYFNIYHSKRHVRQIENILDSIEQGTK